MNICILGAHLPPVMGGIEVHVWELARNLAGRGHVIFLVGHTEDALQLPLFEKKDGVNIYRVGFLRGMRRVSRAFNIFKTVSELHKKHNIDILHAHQVCPAGILGAYIKTAKKIPLVITSHGAVLNDSKSLTKRPLLKFAFKKASHIIAASRELSDTCISAGADDSKLSVVSNAVDINKYNPGIEPGVIRDRYGIRKDEIVVLTLRRLTPKTGVQYLIKVSPYIVNRVPDINFLIAGDSPSGEKNLKEELIRRVKETGLEDKYIFAGSVSQEDVPKYIAAADFAVFPSLAEATSIAALEVMACGKPVVASNVGGLPEIIINGENGLLVDFDTKESSYTDYGLSEDSLKNLEKAIVKMAQDEEMRKEMGLNARRIVESEFSWDKYIDKIETIYRRIV